MPPTRPSPSCSDDFEPRTVGVDQARQHIAAAVRPLEVVERRSLREALGRVLGEDVVAPRDVPGHTNSAVDGYALAGSGLPEAGDAELVVAGTALAGAPFTAECPPGHCVRIMTGAPMPAGTDTVVMQEHVDVPAAGRVRIGAGLRPGSNVRLAGEDVAAGEVALAAGRRLTPADLGILASLGRAEVGVLRRPRVAFFSTGDELRAVGETLDHGQIYDSNRYTLYGMLTRLGVEVLDLGVVADEPGLLRQAFSRAAAEADVVITSGGVSVGDADHVREVLGGLGRLEFWKLAIKPGRPLTFGRLGDTLYFGLPGNPVAVMVTFYQFVQPALQCLAGAGWQEPLAVTATCLEAITKRPGRTEFVRGHLGRDDGGGLTVRPAAGQGSGILSSMHRADCLLVLPEDSTGVAAGEPVTVQPFAAFV